MAENRAKMLCKVYDSALNDEENSKINRNLIEDTKNKRLFSSKSKRLNNLNHNSNLNGELVKVQPSDFKRIINLNYVNSNKKQSNVINKVKLWDNFFQSGQVFGEDGWVKHFEAKV